MAVFLLLFTAYQVFALDEPVTLRVTWENPTKDIEDNELPPEGITGYDIYVSVDGADYVYAKWYPYVHTESTVKEYDHVAKEAGEYCFKLATVTKEWGKSSLSEAVCHTVEEVVEPPVVVPPPAGAPCPPSDIEVIKLKP